MRKHARAHKTGMVTEHGLHRFSLADINRIRAEIGTPQKPDSAKAHIAAVLNFKGGVGKTTTTIHLAHRAAILGLRVLVLDLIPRPPVRSAWQTWYRIWSWSRR